MRDSEVPEVAGDRSDEDGSIGLCDGLFRVEAKADHSDRNKGTTATESTHVADQKEDEDKDAANVFNREHFEQALVLAYAYRCNFAILEVQLAVIISDAGLVHTWKICRMNNLKQQCKNDEVSALQHLNQSYGYKYCIKI